MAFSAAVVGGELVVSLTGWDRLFTWRRAVRVDLREVRSVAVCDRGPLEDEIDHRQSGFGTNDGRRRPGRRRVGTMLGRVVPGRQFWAVPTGPSTARLVVLDVGTGHFSRIVLAVDDRVVEQVRAAVPDR